MGWVAGKTVESLVNTCQAERFGDGYPTHIIKHYRNFMFTLL